jgi:hypothetical protein
VYVRHGDGGYERVRRRAGVEDYLRGNDWLPA